MPADFSIMLTGDEARAKVDDQRQIDPAQEAIACQRLAQAIAQGRSPIEPRNDIGHLADRVFGLNCGR